MEVWFAFIFILGFHHIIWTENYNILCRPWPRRCKRNKLQKYVRVCVFMCLERACESHFSVISPKEYSGTGKRGRLISHVILHCFKIVNNVWFLVICFLISLFISLRILMAAGFLLSPPSPSILSFPSPPSFFPPCSVNPCIPTTHCAHHLFLLSLRSRCVTS